jgi:hypothetical protein
MTSKRSASVSSIRHPLPLDVANSTPKERESSIRRRDWLISASAAISACTLPFPQAKGTETNPGLLADTIDSKPKFGLVTYLWGKDMDLTTVIKACQHSGMGGVELRTEHKHLVEPKLSSAERKAVGKQFADSGIELIGYGSNCEFHSPKPEVLAANIELCKKYIQLMHDCGGSGVKVKPNGFAPNVANEKTIEQIGKALNELAAYGEGYGQEIRLEVHGSKTSQLSVIRDIFQVADHKNATVCWNCNGEDLQAPGLAANFAMVRNRFGETLHARELDSNDYPYQELVNLLISTQFKGWVLLEARTDPKDKFAAMKQQRELFDEMIKIAMKQPAKQAPTK